MAGLGGWQGAGQPPNAPDVAGIDPGGGGSAASTACLWPQQGFSMGSWLCSFRGKPPTSFSPGSLADSPGWGLLSSIWLRKDTAILWTGAVPEWLVVGLFSRDEWQG